MSVNRLSKPLLAEALGDDDDWTGLTDAAARRKRQNRLNVRAYRRRQALKSKTNIASTSESQNDISNVEMKTPIWIENQQRVVFISHLVGATIDKNGLPPLIPQGQPASSTAAYWDAHIGITFPLSQDHLITIMQYNTLRGCLANRRLLSVLGGAATNECTTAALHVLPFPTDSTCIPCTLCPTALQQQVPHEDWVDIIPHAVLRDNIIMALGCFDEDDLWSDIMGGLFEGFPDSEVEHRGVIAWSTPWLISGWELSEGFVKKWGWCLKNCEDVLEATNAWRRIRGDRPLMFMTTS
ncbi:hypothetical protein GGI43DRAFT_432396 [Trichoderma evansii]